MCNLDVLVDSDACGYVAPFQQLEDATAQNRAQDRVDAHEAPAGGQLLVDGGIDVTLATDNAAQQDALQRHKTVSQCKREFKKIMEREGLMRLSKKSPQVFHLAAAPVAAPGTSKHSTGYAIDIQGDNGAIKNVCKSRGATLVFDEKSHVHVEFANA